MSEANEKLLTGSASYHDVVCILGCDRIHIAQNYAYELRCSRAAGWSLWRVWAGAETRIADEFGEPKLQIEVKGVRIL